MLFALLAQQSGEAAPEPPPWSPTDFPGLSSWVSAKDLSGLGDGADVTSWANKVGGADAFVTAIAPPSKQTVAGDHAVLFDRATGENLITTADTIADLLGSVFLIAAVAHPVGAFTAGPNPWDSDALVSDTDGYVQLGGRGANWEFWVWDGDAVTVAAAATLGQRVVLMAWRDTGGNLNLELDGVAATPAAQGPPQVTSTLMQLGGQYDSAPNPFFDGYLFEVVMATSAGSAGDRASLLAYLQGEWGL